MNLIYEFYFIIFLSRLQEINSISLVLKGEMQVLEID